MHVERVRVHVDAGFDAADHVRHHIAERALGNLLGLELASPDHAAGRGGYWRKMKGSARIRLRNGRIRLAELRWYEAHGIGKKEFRRKRYLDSSPEIVRGAHATVSRMRQGQDHHGPYTHVATEHRRMETA